MLGPIVRDQQDVIVVTMNYRVNIFGYPSAGALDGHNLNPGLLDHRAAVEWVYNHIQAFGGDPSRIILWGQSAGGSAVDKYS
jgi:cholinesterase